MRQTISIFCVLLFSCSPLRPWKAVASDPDVTTEKKSIISAKVAQMFPSQTKYLPGEVITTIDTILQDRFEIIRDTITGTDTVVKFKTVIKTIAKTDTVFTPDPAAAASLFECYQNLTATETKLKAFETLNAEHVKKAEGHEKRERKGWYWFAGLLLVVIVFIVIKLMK